MDWLKRKQETMDLPMKYRVFLQICASTNSSLRTFTCLQQLRYVMLCLVWLKIVRSLLAPVKSSGSTSHSDWTQAQLPHCSCDFWHFSTRPRGTQKHEVRWHCIAVGDHKISKFSVSSFLVLCLNHPYLLFPFCFGPHSRCCEKFKRLEPSPGQCNPASVPGCRSCPES